MVANGLSEWVDPLNDMQALILSYKTGQITFRNYVQELAKHDNTIKGT